MKVRLFVVALGLLLSAALPATAPAQVTLPPSFVVQDLVPGVTFDTPTSICFLPDNRMLVAEKRGRVWSVKGGLRYSTPTIAIESEVLDEHDRGLLCVACDPNYNVTNRFVYLLYTVDPDSDGVDNNDNGFGRLVRYSMSTVDSNIVVPSSRTILMGYNWPNGPVSDWPSHSIGSLRFGRDGSLLVSSGEGASYTEMDAGGLDPTAYGSGKTDPYEDIGAFRAQYIGSLGGKVLRINPLTGHGYASNPYADNHLGSVRSRVWAYGFRNPFRFCVRPGTGSTDTSAANPGTIYIGDVGWDTFEEMNVAPRGGMNFGWPCNEGFGQQSSYATGNPAHNGCNSYGTSTNPVSPTAPTASWHHSNPAWSEPTGIFGNCSIGGVFYSGSTYPAQYHGQYFFADYGQNWLKVAVVNSSDQIQQFLDFGANLDGPVDFKTDPSSGDIVYVSITDGKVRRIRYLPNGSNLPPTPMASATPDVGLAPLTVQCSSAGTTDPENDPLTFSWIFGDGQGSNAANPVHVFSSPGNYNVILTADDGHGNQASTTVLVIAGTASSFPSTPVLDNFNRADGAIGGSWGDQIGGMVIRSNHLTQTSTGNSIVWDGDTFGPDQEAFVTISTMSPASDENDLMLKLQGPLWSDGHVEVRYDGTLQQVMVSTFNPNLGWQTWAVYAIPFASGDQFGARAFSNGNVEIYKNRVLVATTSVAAWPYSSLGGGIGLTLYNSTASRLDDFGGGNIVVNVNSPPIATIVSPANNLFFAAADTIRLIGTATDQQDASSALQFHWQMDIHHNNHIHPSSFVADGPNNYYIGQNHDDGTGVFEEIKLMVTDTGGLVDTARVFIYPDIDLKPSAVATVPSTPGTTAPAQYRFKLYDTGKMPAPISHWVLRADATTLAQGDTLVPARDSVAIVLTLPPTLAAGNHTLRVVADSIGTVHETDETNNATTRKLTVVTGPGPDEVPPLWVRTPIASPSGVIAHVSWSTNEPASGAVRFGTTPSLGDSVTVPRDTAETALLQNLVLATRYYFRVAATDTAGNTAVAAPDSFMTQAGPLGVGDGAPTALALSSAYPNPSVGPVRLELALPSAARVEFAVFDLQGRVVWSAPARALAPGRWTLSWPGFALSGERLRQGVYQARVMVDGKPLMRRLAVLR